MIEVSMQELALQDADVLPIREALDANLAWVDAVNVAIANGGHHGDAFARATQTLVVLQNNR